MNNYEYISTCTIFTTIIAGNATHIHHTQILSLFSLREVWNSNSIVRWILRWYVLICLALRAPHLTFCLEFGKQQVYSFRNQSLRFFFHRLQIIVAVKTKINSQYLENLSVLRPKIRQYVTWTNLSDISSNYYPVYTGDLTRVRPAFAPLLLFTLEKLSRVKERTRGKLTRVKTKSSVNRV